MIEGVSAAPKGPVLLDITDGIARLRLGRARCRQRSMSAELMGALCDAIMVCHGHPDLRVVLLSGEGTNFPARAAMSAPLLKGEKLPDYIRQATAYLQNAVTGLLRARGAGDQHRCKGLCAPAAAASAWSARPTS